MHSFSKVFGAAALAGALALTAISPVMAKPGQHAPGQGGNQPGAVKEQPWLMNSAYHHRWVGHRWTGPRYYHRGYYNRGYGGYGYGYGYDPGAAVAAGVIGGVFGAIAGQAIHHSGSSHVARCESAYRSYRPATNTYTGYDGKTHVCRL